MIGLLAIFLASFIVCFIVTPWLMPRLVTAGLTGVDVNKERKVVLPEMGGIAIIAGYIVAVLMAIGLTTFNILALDMNLSFLLAGLSTVVIMALVGMVDDLFLMRQSVKALLPVFAALPLVAVKAGVTSMNIPLVGMVDFGLLYPLILIPIGITGASNATNMLAGFNGLEAGLGIVMTATTTVAAVMLGQWEAAVISAAMLGALLAFIFFNWYPAKVLIGDVGTLSVGAVVATAVILGNMERVGIILIIPFLLELFLKGRSWFQASAWGSVRGGKLFWRDRSEIYGWGRLLMYLSGGITEKRLTLTVIIVELFFGVVAVLSMMV